MTWHVLGVGSLLSCRLSMDAIPARTLGGINLYSTGVDGFDEQVRTLGMLLSTLAAVVVDASRREAQLHVALQSRAVIGGAVGIRRSQSNISGQDAFAMLVHASQRMIVKSARGRRGHHRAPGSALTLDPAGY